MPDACLRQKRVSNPKELYLGTIESHYVCPGNKPQSSLPSDLRIPMLDQAQWHIPLTP